MSLISTERRLELNNMFLLHVVTKKVDAPAGMASKSLPCAMDDVCRIRLPRVVLARGGSQAPERLRPPRFLYHQDRVKSPLGLVSKK